MTAAWQRLPERSNTFWLRVITFIALRMGRTLARGLLYPISAYFLIVRNQTWPASRAYLRRALGREPNWRDGFRQYHTFACTLLDRLFVLAGRDDCLDLRLHGLDVLERQLASGQGCLLVGSHLGSFEVLRAVGRCRRGLRIKAMMDTEATPQITRLYRALNPALHEDIIQVGEPAALLGLQEHVAAGGWLALLGDRCVGEEKRVRCRFFGEPVWLPEAPVVLSQILQAPLLLFFCLHSGWGRYEIHFEPLADYRPLPRGQRAAEAARIMQQYAGRLEHHCRRHPYNWFNFHDVWQDAP